MSRYQVSVVTPNGAVIVTVQLLDPRSVVQLLASGAAVLQLPARPRP
jgi:hypothetical protein